MSAFSPLLQRYLCEAAPTFAASFTNQRRRLTLDDALTQNERDIVERLEKRFPGAPPTAEIQHVIRPGGVVETLHLSWNRDIVVDVDRAIIAWPSESPRRIAEAIEAQLEVHGLVASPFSVAPGPGIFSRIAASARTPFARLSSPEVGERALVGRRDRT